MTWYFGTDGNTPPGQYDFVSVVLHELGHGFGFAGSAYVINNVIGDVGGVTTGDIPNAFDLFTVTHTGASLLSFPNETLALAAPLLSAYNPLDPLGPGVFWAGAAGKAANGGVTPRLYTPAIWEQGSSYSHLEEQVFPEGNPNSLMTHLLAAAEAIHDPGPITLGMFDDMGWNGRPELITNGSFTNGMTAWTPFASVTNSLGVTTQDNNYIQHTVTNGVLEYTRVGPTPPDTATSAVVLQNTGAPFGAGEQMVAAFQAANSSTVRKRLSVLMHDQDFSDLSVCTFWLEPFTPLLTYKMLTHTTKAWTGASISFYAANAGSNGGAYQIDNVSLRAAPTAVAAETRCIDPWYLPYDTTPDFPEMLGNASFSSGTLPPWQTFGTLTSQVSEWRLRIHARLVGRRRGRAAAADRAEHGAWRHPDGALRARQQQRREKAGDGPAARSGFLRFVGVHVLAGARSVAEAVRDARLRDRGLGQRDALDLCRVGGHAAVDAGGQRVVQVDAEHAELRCRLRRTGQRHRRRPCPAVHEHVRVQRGDAAIGHPRLALRYSSAA